MDQIPKHSESNSESVDTQEFRDVLGRFASGVTVITTVYEEAILGMTASAFVSVSLEPALVLVSIDKEANLHNILLEDTRFGISILSEGQLEISDHFAGRNSDEVEAPFVELGGAHLIEGAIAHIVADVVQIHPAGDHTLFVAEVRYLDSYEGKPLMFYRGQYKKLGFD
jgi:flavin reductase (DIM6/NTAB) family NADH-FMN oxidoreductase RutF